jgi:hypothetical protein
MKKKLLMIVLFCLGIAGIASAVEVINIDLNVDGDANAWTGTAGYDGGTEVWQAYYGGQGKAMGSQRSANLVNYDEPCKPSTYAAQVWISNGDSGNHETYRDVNISNLLMCDGFKKKTAATADPNICLFGWDAYTGKFDIYVYGIEAGDFNLAVCDVNVWWEPNNVGAPDANVHPADGNTFKLHNDSKWTYTKKSVSGGFTGDFEENQNYVVFPSVDVNTYRGTITASDANTDTNTVLLSVNKIYIIYTKRINGIQLVSTKRPVAIYNTELIEARNYDVAYETNARSGETQHFGPDTAPPDVASMGFGYVTYLDGGEYMKYDIKINDVNEGEYRVKAYVYIRDSDANYLEVYIDDIDLGTLSAGNGQVGDPPYVYPTNSVNVNIFEGSHTFKWSMPRVYYFNIIGFEFDYAGPINMPDCNAVYKYGFADNYKASDLNHDCHVDFKDLKIITNDWLKCYSPDPNDCS